MGALNANQKMERAHLEYRLNVEGTGGGRGLPWYSNYDPEKAIVGILNLVNNLRSDVWGWVKHKTGSVLYVQWAIVKDLQF